jgi:RNA polymerase sigma factor (sigma-70 family)
MTATASPPWVKQRASADGPLFVRHDSFLGAEAERTYDPGRCEDPNPGQSHMPDEVTRDQARRMHYAAYRMSCEDDPRRREAWRRHYLAVRDRIVLGNRKLIYRAVRRWNPPSGYADDLVGDCQIVLIQAVAAYNPWIGVRFSTYAFTCLMRALARITQKNAARSAQVLPLDAFPDPAPGDEDEAPHFPALDVYLGNQNDLLSAREKEVIVRRFQLDRPGPSTLEAVGRELGLSKERVRQVQASALDKLRQALGGG